MTKTKMCGLKWDGFYCPACKKKSIVHCLKDIGGKNRNISGELFSEHLRDKLSNDQSQYCMACGWWGIIVEI